MSGGLPCFRGRLNPYGIGPIGSGDHRVAPLFLRKIALPPAVALGSDPSSEPLSRSKQRGNPGLCELNRWIHRASQGFTSSRTSPFPSLYAFPAISYAFPVALTQFYATPAARFPPHPHFPLIFRGFQPRCSTWNIRAPLRGMICYAIPGAQAGGSMALTRGRCRPPSKGVSRKI